MPQPHIQNREASLLCFSSMIFTCMFWYVLVFMLVSLQIRHVFWFLCPLWSSIPSCMPYHNLTNADTDSLTQSLSDGEEQLDRLQHAELTRNTRMSLWRAGAVQAWLEVVMGMPMYLRACSENIKSGKVDAARGRVRAYVRCMGMLFSKEAALWSLGAAGPDRWGFGAGSGNHSPHPSQETETSHRGLQEGRRGSNVSGI